jgi:hypothetical protein
MATVVVREGQSKKPKGWYPTRGKKIEDETNLGKPYIVKRGKKVPAQMSVTGWNWRENADNY